MLVVVISYVEDGPALLAVNNILIPEELADGVVDCGALTDGLDVQVQVMPPITL